MRRGGVWEEEGGDERREDTGMGMGDVLLGARGHAGGGRRGDGEG